MRKRPIGSVAMRITLACLAGVTLTPPWHAVEAADGRGLYVRHCAPCHGREGRGDGPDAALFDARPRNLREGFLKQYGTDELVRRLLEGKPLELGRDLPGLRARAAQTEAIVAHLRRLPSVNWNLAGAGWDVYADRCELCHGAYGEPGAMLPEGVKRPRDLADPSFQRGINDRDLIAAVRHGRQGMPGLVPRVTEEDAKSLAAFVRLLSPGFETYSQYCAHCHGDDGAGMGPGAGADLPSVVFDKSYFGRRTPEEIREGVWHMIGTEKPRMPHFRWSLDAARVRAIIEYLQTLE